MTAHAGDTNVNSSVDSKSSSQVETNSQSGSYNGGNNIITNNPGTVDYKGGFTQRNVPSMSMGSFGNSFSSNYCSGTAQATVGVAGFGGGVGYQKLDEGCQLLQASDMLMRMASTYRAQANSQWEFAKQFNGTDAAKTVAQVSRDASFASALKADRLESAAVNNVCSISDKILKNMVAAGLDCPKQ
jgi:hypothetical protein